MAYYGTEDYGIVHFPFNFRFVNLNTFLNAPDLQAYVSFWLTAMPPGNTPNWVVRTIYLRACLIIFIILILLFLFKRTYIYTLRITYGYFQAENHDNLRIGNRLCEEYMDIITVTIMTLPGVACIYYGQEIGMMNSKVRVDQRKDPNNDGNSGNTRDGERLPMQWDDSMNAGK